MLRNVRISDLSTSIITSWVLWNAPINECQSYKSRLYMHTWYHLPNPASASLLQVSCKPSNIAHFLGCNNGTTSSFSSYITPSSRRSSGSFNGTCANFCFRSTPMEDYCLCHTWLVKSNDRDTGTIGSYTCCWRMFPTSRNLNEN